MTITVSTTVTRELKALGQGAMMQELPTDISVKEAAIAYAALNALEKAIAKRKASLREQVLEAAKSHGIEDPKGHRRYDLDEAIAIAERRSTSMPDEAKFCILLEAKGIEKKEAYIQKTVWAYSADLVENLVNIGKIKESEVENLKEVTFALKVQPEKDLKMLLEEVLGKQEEDSDRPAKKTAARTKR